MPERGWFRERLGLTNGPLLMYLGTLSPRKQPDMLARAGAALARPNVQLVFAGNDMGEARAVRRACAGSDLTAHAIHGPASGPHGTPRSRQPTSSCIRRTTKCSAWYRSRRSRQARR